MATLTGIGGTKGSAGSCMLGAVVGTGSSGAGIAANTPSTAGLAGIATTVATQ